VFDTRS